MPVGATIAPNVAEEDDDRGWVRGTRSAAAGHGKFRPSIGGDKMAASLSRNVS